MKNREKNSSEGNSILLAIMFIIIIVLLVYIIFFTGGAGSASGFYKDALKLQNNVSYYLGATNAKMFDAYEIENIITGYNTEGEIITNLDEENMKPIAQKNSMVESGGVKYYKLDSDNVKSELNCELPKYSNMEWYVSMNGDLKVKFSGATPKWWDSSLDSLKI